MTTRRILTVVAAVALILGGIVGMNRLDRRANLLRKQAAYHRHRARELNARAADWEALARDPSRESNLPMALFKAGQWSEVQALEVELESLHTPSRPAWKRLSREAKSLAAGQAQTCRRMSESYTRQYRRYERAALNPWLSVDLGPTTP